MGNGCKIHTKPWILIDLTIFTSNTKYVNTWTTNDIGGNIFINAAYSLKAEADRMLCHIVPLPCSEEITLWCKDGIPSFTSTAGKDGLSGK